MATKLIPWLLVIIAVMVVVIVILANRKPPEIISVVTQVDTLVVVKEVKVPIYRDKVITKYDTLHVDGHEYTVAEYSETIDTTNVKLDLNIKYWEQRRKFDVKADITTSIPTVYITETITNTIEKPYPAFAFTAGLTPMFNHANDKFNLQGVGLSAGVRINGKYDLEAVGTTDATFGVGFKVRF